MQLDTQLTILPDAFKSKFSISPVAIDVPKNYVRDAVFPGILKGFIELPPRNVSPPGTLNFSKFLNDLPAPLLTESPTVWKLILRFLLICGNPGYDDGLVTLVHGGHSCT